jgi:hypothetical protein
VDLNLKRVLMQVGNELVTRHGFEPSGPAPASIMRATIEGKVTHPLTYFTQFLNMCPEARELLEEHGFVWPMDLGDEIQQS